MPAGEAPKSRLGTPSNAHLLHLQPDPPPPAAWLFAAARNAVWRPSLPVFRWELLQNVGCVCVMRRGCVCSKMCAPRHQVPELPPWSGPARDLPCHSPMFWDPGNTRGSQQCGEVPCRQQEGNRGWRVASGGLLIAEQVMLSAAWGLAGRDWRSTDCSLELSGSQQAHLKSQPLKSSPKMWLW